MLALFTYIRMVISYARFETARALHLWECQDTLHATFYLVTSEFHVQSIA